MKSTISAMLISDKSRSSDLVESKLAEELSAGFPWWSVAED